MSFLSQVRAIIGAIPRAQVRRDAHRYLQTAGNCRAAQAATLSRLLALNGDSDFSREHGLAQIGAVDEFQKRMPIAGFDHFLPWIEKLKLGNTRALLGSANPLLMFALSSGTTANSKFIPITRPFIDDYRRGWQIWGIRTLDDHPGCNSRTIVQISSSHDRSRTRGGTPCGSISGLVTAMQKRIVRSMYTVPAAVAQIPDPLARYYTLLRIALADDNVGMVTTANPSTLIHLAQLAETHRDLLLRDITEGRLSAEFEVAPSLREQLRPWTARRSPNRARQLSAIAEQTGRWLPRDYWPGLQVVAVWTGGSAGAYLPKLREYYGPIAIRDHGLSASEGRMTIPIVSGTSAGLLDVHSHFFEFIPEAEYGSAQPVVLRAEDLEEGGRYYILLTTASGLYRYDICDVVRCAGFFGSTPQLEFLHKGAHVANLTGEKITEFQVVSAVGAAAEKSGVQVSQFTVCPVWGDPPGYALLMEGFVGPDSADAQRLADSVDRELQSRNCEYHEKRSTGRLRPLVPRVMPWGSFLRLQHERLRMSGGTEEQYKHPCLVPDLQFWERFVISGQLTGSRPAASEPQPASIGEFDALTRSA